MERDGVKPLVNNIGTDLKILQRRKTETHRGTIHNYIA